MINRTTPQRKDRLGSLDELDSLGDDFIKTSLPTGKAAADGLRVIDTPDAITPTNRQNNPVPKQEVKALTLQEAGVGGFGTPGEQVAFRTAKGVPEPDELDNIGKGVSSIGKALANPGVQRALAQAGIAFSQGSPNAPGTILGQGALGIIESKQIAELADALANGGNISDVDTTGLSPQGFQQAEAIASSRQSTQQRSRSLDIEQQRADLQTRVTDLQERGLDLDESKFDFSKIESAQDLAVAEAQVEIAQNRQTLNEEIAASEIALNEARTKALESGFDKDSPEYQESIRLRRQQFIETLSGRLETEQEVLSTLKRRAEANSEENRSFVNRVSFGLVGDDNPSSNFDSLVEEQEKYVNELKSKLTEQENLASESLGGNSKESDTDPVLGSNVDNPIPISSQEELNSAAVGTYIQVGSRVGIVTGKNQDGSPKVRFQ